MAEDDKKSLLSITSTAESPLTAVRIVAEETISELFRFEIDVVAAGAVAALTGDAEDGPLALVFIGCAGHVFEPGVVALKAARGRFPPEVAHLGIGVERGHAPAVLRVQPAPGREPRSLTRHSLSTRG